MSDPDKIRLRSYLDQEAMGVREQWESTEPTAKLDFMEWLAMDHETESREDVPKQWLQFATRCAMLHLQSIEVDK